MDHERRQVTLEQILIELGSIRAHSEIVFKKVDELEKRVAIQNGRVAKGEIWRAYITGAVAILTTMVMPVVFMLVNEFVKGGFHNG